MKLGIFLRLVSKLKTPQTLTALTSNKYTVKDSFSFVYEIVEQDSEFFMRSLDIGSPLINILLEATINIWTNTSFENTKKVESCIIE